MTHEPTAHRVTWFYRPPDRPVDGGTVFTRPANESPTDHPPRVWLAGDIVPAGVMALAPNNYVIPANSRPYRAATPLVEMPWLPAFGELVTAEKARREEEGEAG